MSRNINVKIMVLIPSNGSKFNQMYAKQFNFWPFKAIYTIPSMFEFLVSVSQFTVVVAGEVQ